VALDFPNNPGIGSVFTDTTSGFSYEWDGTVWKSYSAASSNNVKIITDISGSFNGSTQTFALTSSGTAVTPPNAQSLIVNLGGITQKPTVDYTVSSSNISFVIAPSSGLSFSAVLIGPAVPITTIPDGTTTQGAFNVAGNLNVTGIATASSFVGNLTGTASTASFATTSFGLSGTPNIVVGVSTLGITSTTDLRVSSVSDRTTIVSGNSVSLAYNTGGGNVAICTNPTGPITLNVTGIPTDASFNNRSISFAVIAVQTATAYACTSVTLNGVVFGANATVGVQTHIAYSGGTVATGSTTGFDVFNFTGINTTGSASTTLNYKILSNVNGGYRRY